MKPGLPITATLPALFTLCACSAPPPQPAAMVLPPASAASTPWTDAWVGAWNGPEGSSLHIAGSDGRYEITLRNLEGPRRYAGRTAGNCLEFERNGRIEPLCASTGAQTGMKWLADKKNCLTVRAGEGYCRD
jgi:hypothetical protein